MEFTSASYKQFVGCIINRMNRRLNQGLRAAQVEIQETEAELEELSQQLLSFEALVDARLGDLLDQLSGLNYETALLDEKIRHIREERLFGTDLIRYLDGAPKPTRPINLNDLPPLGLPHRKAIHTKADILSLSPELQIPEIKALYRKLARRHHPDLARSDVDRLRSTEQMAEINQAYNAGDLQTLMRLAGMSIPYGVELHQPHLQPGKSHHESLSEPEQMERKLKSVRQQIAQLSNLPIVKLSLEVKLARHQGRDLLGEMAADLQRKLARKLAERDYLASQIQASGAIEDS